MTSDWPPSTGDWDDDDNDVYAGSPMELDGLPDYSGYSPTDDDTHDDWIVEPDDNRQPPTDKGDETVETLLVTATNPSSSVTATALMDGRVFQVQLSSTATKMTESELADEIVKVCALATRQAEAAQYHLIATLMDGLGQDPAGTRAFLEHNIGLPSPQTVRNEKAQMFADHYADHE
ncbi:YbaB/EbfC family DNA-binding protein [Mycolicibacterium boenickei]